MRSSHFCKVLLLLLLLLPCFAASKDGQVPASLSSLKFEKISGKDLAYRVTRQATGPAIKLRAASAFNAGQYSSASLSQNSASVILTIDFPQTQRLALYAALDGTTKWYFVGVLTPIPPPVNAGNEPILGTDVIKGFDAASFAFNDRRDLQANREVRFDPKKRHYQFYVEWASALPDNAELAVQLFDQYDPTVATIDPLADYVDPTSQRITENGSHKDKLKITFFEEASKQHKKFIVYVHCQVDGQWTIWKDRYIIVSFDH